MASPKTKEAIAKPLNAGELTKVTSPEQRLVAITHALCLHFQQDTGIPCNYATPLMGSTGLGHTVNSLQSELNYHIAPLYGVALAVSGIPGAKLIVNLAQAILSKQGQ